LTEALAAEQSELSLEATFFAFLLYPKTCLYPKKKGLLNPFFLFPAKDTFTGILWIWMDPLDMIKLIQDSHTTYVIKAHRGMLGNVCLFVCYKTRADTAMSLRQARQKS